MMAADAVPSARGRRVLVVDDDSAIRKMVSTVLERHGFLVDTACDGVEALAKLGEAVYELLVLDLMMPRLDGFGVLEQLADATAANPPPRVLIMSAAAPSLLNRLPREHVAAVLTKPFDIRLLIDNAKMVRAGSGPIDDPAN